MRVIKPYGRSETHLDKEGKKLERRLRPNTDQRESIDIVEFGLERKSPEFTIAQWVSEIDKIVRKPPSGKEPGEEQYELRNRIGDAAWKLILNKQLLGLPDDSDRLERLWWKKIHSYGKPKKTDQSQQSRPYWKGRWYRSFVGDIDKPEAVNAEDVAKKLYRHIYEKASRIAGGPSKVKGRMEARLQSVKTSVRSPIDEKLSLFPIWTEKDKKQYCLVGECRG